MKFESFNVYYKAYFPNMPINFPNSIYIVFFVFLPKHGLFCMVLQGVKEDKVRELIFFGKFRFTDNSLLLVCSDLMLGKIVVVKF